MPQVPMALLASVGNISSLYDILQVNTIKYLF